MGKQGIFTVVIAIAALVTALSSVAAADLPDSSGELVLGSKAYALHGAGFGAAHPPKIFNGGAPSGLVEGVKWRHWGQPAAVGWGSTAIYKPGGGYYAKRVRIKLRAGSIATCDGRPAYTRLEFRAPRRPGGPLGSWQSWSGSGSICGEPRAETCDVGGGWGRNAYYSVSSVSGISCRQAMTLLYRHEPDPPAALFEEAPREVAVAAFRCVTGEVSLESVGIYERGMGHAVCSSGERSFGFEYRA